MTCRWEPKLHSLVWRTFIRRKRSRTVFENLVGAAETKEAKILDAQAYASATNALASAEASNRVWIAEANKHRAIADGLARAALFTNQVLAYRCRAGPQRRVRATRDAG